MKNAKGKIIYKSLFMIFLLFVLGCIFIEKFYMSHVSELTLVYFHAFYYLFGGIAFTTITLVLINIKLPKTDFSNKQSQEFFFISIFFIFITYFVIGEYLWSFLLSGLTEINLLKANSPEILTRFIPTIGAGLIFFYKIFGYMQNFNLNSFETNLKESLPFILSESVEFKVIKDIIRDLIIGSVFLTFLIMGITEKTITVQYTDLWSDAILSALIVSLIFTFLEVYAWLVTIQYKEDLLNYKNNEDLNQQQKKYSKEYNVKHRIYSIEKLKNSERLKQIYSFFDKRRPILYLFLILVLILFGYFWIKTVEIGDEYVSLRANIINVSMSDIATGEIYYSEIVYPNERQISLQLGKISAINNTHVIKKVDEDRANAQLQNMVKNGYLNIDIKDAFSCMKMRVNKNKVKNLTSYMVPQDETQLWLSPIDGDVFLFLSERLNITQFYELSLTDYSMNGEDIYYNKLNILYLFS